MIYRFLAVSRYVRSNSTTKDPSVLAATGMSGLVFTCIYRGLTTMPQYLLKSFSVRGLLWPSSYSGLIRVLVGWNVSMTCAFNCFYINIACPSHRSCATIQSHFIFKHWVVSCRSFMIMCSFGTLKACRCHTNFQRISIPCLYNVTISNSCCETYKSLPRRDCFSCLSLPNTFTVIHTEVLRLVLANRGSTVLLFDQLLWTPSAQMFIVPI